MDADTPCATAIVKVEEIAGMATGLNRGRTIIRCLSRGIAVAAILTLFGVVTTGSGSAKTSTEATVTRSSTAPHQLLGKWSRNVTAAVSIEGIAKRAGAWSIVIGKSAGRVENSLEIYAPGDRPAFPSTSSGITVTGNRLSFTPNSGFEYAFCFRKGIYGWKVSGRSLAFTKVSDKCPARTAFLTGVWKRS
jgi:hypothetical protein